MKLTKLQGCLRIAQFCEIEALRTLGYRGRRAFSWLIPSVAHLLPDLEPFGVEGLSMSTLERALQRSAFGLRLDWLSHSVHLQDLFDRPASPSPLYTKTAAEEVSLSADGVRD